jgi:hypothetical protein
MGICGGLAGIPMSILQEDAHDRSDATLTEVITASITKVLAGGRCQGCSAGVRQRRGPIGLSPTPGDVCTLRSSPVAANIHGAPTHRIQKVNSSNRPRERAAWRASREAYLPNYLGWRQKIEREADGSLA